MPPLLTIARSNLRMLETLLRQSLFFSIVTLAALFKKAIRLIICYNVSIGIYFFDTMGVYVNYIMT